MRLESDKYKHRIHIPFLNVTVKTRQRLGDPGVKFKLEFVTPWINLIKRKQYHDKEAIYIQNNPS